MSGHNAQAFEQRGTLVAGCHPFCKIISQDLAYIRHWQAAFLGVAHYAYAPVVVGRIAVTEVVKEAAGGVRTHIKRLMANQHPKQERARCEAFWSRETPVANELPGVIYKIRLSVSDHWPPCSRKSAYGGSYLLYSADVVKFVTGIQEYDIITLRIYYGLVHRVIETSVWLPDEAY